MHFARDARIAYQGPDGGNGGHGGNIWIEADSTVNNFFHLKDSYSAQNGGNGRTNNAKGKIGEDLLGGCQLILRKLLTVTYAA